MRTLAIVWMVWCIVFGLLSVFCLCMGFRPTWVHACCAVVQGFFFLRAIRLYRQLRQTPEPAPGRSVRRQRDESSVPCWLCRVIGHKWTETRKYGIDGMMASEPVHMDYCTRCGEPAPCAEWAEPDEPPPLTTRERPDNATA
jgi:hypothetical protein